jgi:hypothetical protein
VKHNENETRVWRRKFAIFSITRLLIIVGRESQCEKHSPTTRSDRAERQRELQQTIRAERERSLEQTHKVREQQFWLGF